MDDKNSASQIDEEEEENDASQSRISGGPSPLGQSSVYDIINKAVNGKNQGLNHPWPRRWKARLKYLFLMPITHS